MRFHRTLIINPPNPPGFVSNKDSMGGFGQLYPLGAPPFPPVDMVYLASFLTEKKISIDIFECNGLHLSKEQIQKKITDICISAGNAPLLVIIRTSAPTLDWDIAVCRDIKEKEKNIKICIYGPVVAKVSWRIKEELFLDYIVKGEPDETICELLTTSEENTISGLIYRNGSDWIENPDRGMITDIDRWPIPKWELFPYKKYTLPKSSATSPLPFLPMLTSRGCPFGCSYCTYPIGQGVKWRFRSPGNVVDEIEHLVKRLNIEYIIFRDPIFSLDQKRVVEICTEIEKRKLKVQWRCETRIDCLSRETLSAMARAGCDGINIGIESSETDIQTNAGRKPISKEDALEIITICRELNIKTFCFFIIGLPGDTTQTILESIAFAIDLKPNWIQFTAASPYIGTQLREWAISRGLIEEDKYAYANSHHVIMGNENLSREQIKSLHTLAKFIQNYLINRKGILKDDNNPSMIYQAVKSFADLICYGIAHQVFAFGKKRFELKKT